MHRIPNLIPVRHTAATVQTVLTPDVNTGSYDFSIGGIGFRYAIDETHSYKRYSEPTTSTRFDNSNEPGEQTLAPLPWSKSQSSFHAGAGQLNLEQPLSQFQYQEAQVAHLRYDMSYGVDIWTPGVVKRLPDCTFSNWGFVATTMAVASVGGIDYAIVGGVGGFYQLKWTSGPDVAPDVQAIDAAGSNWGTGGQANITVQSITTDGSHYYAIVTLAVANGAGYKSMLVTGGVDSVAASTILFTDSTNTWTGVVGFVKSRVMLGVLGKAYEIPLGGAAAALSTLTPKYTHPITGWNWTAISESPSAILMAGQNSLLSAVLSFTLDSSGGTPTLTGGANVETLPAGEYVTSMLAYAGSFLAIGTNKGVHAASFDTYSGALTVGPLSLSTTSPVLALAGRDRFLYAGYTNQQADGSTGLARLDLSEEVDTAGRKAWAPDLRPPTDATTRVGTVRAVGNLPLSQRIVFITDGGIHVEGAAPGTDGEAWLRTSRIRYDTAELKLFKLGRIHGTLDTSAISIVGVVPFGPTVNLGTFGYVAGGDPGQFRLPTGTNEWVQLEFHLSGASCLLSSYEIGAYPAPRRQHIIEVPALCYRKEKDRFGREAVDPMTPRDRYEAIVALEKAGDELRYVEYGVTGTTAQLVIIDQQQIEQTIPPSKTDDFGGVVLLKLRTTES